MDLLYASYDRQELQINNPWSPNFTVSNVVGDARSLATFAKDSRHVRSIFGFEID